MEEIREVNDDVISFRYYSDYKLVNSLSFQETLETIESTKQMILTAGSSVINPVLFHKRLSRGEAVDLLKSTRFRHTQEGSFILKISCPVRLESIPTPNLFGDDSAKPLSRRAFELINQASSEIVTAIEENKFRWNYLNLKEKDTKPVISYNLCDALIGLFDDERNYLLK